MFSVQSWPATIGSDLPLVLTPTTLGRWEETIAHDRYARPTLEQENATLNNRLLEYIVEPENSPTQRLSRLEVQEPSQGFRLRLCHVIIAIGLLTLLVSLTIALWWSLTKNDVSGGFTMAAYIVAIVGLPLGSIQIRHNRRCKCWRNRRERRTSESDSD